MQLFRYITLLTIFTWTCSIGAFSQVNTKPKVLILTTGGTIASQTNAPLIDGPALVQAMPALADYAQIEVEELVKIGSSKMTPAIWLKLVKRLKTRIDADPDLVCIVITHGTDTMEETAYFLNLTHQSEVPVVLVGSMRSSNAISADGPANLVNAVRVGTSAEAKGKGVLVVLNDNIIGARDLLKQHNTRVDAFAAPEQGFLGSVDAEKVVFYREPFRRHTTKSDFDVYKLDTLARIDILQDFAGIDEEIVDYYLQRPNNGLVISSFAGGRLSQAASQVYQLRNHSKPIVIASSIKTGRIFGSHQAGTSVIIANDLPANKARILLMLVLIKSNTLVEIQDYFDQY